MSTESTPQQIIFQQFDEAAVEGWVPGEIEYRQVGKTGEASMRAYSPDDSLSYPDLGGFAFSKAMRALRSAMAQPGTGAWFSAEIKLTGEGGFTMDVDYDSEPAWKVPIVAETYVEEQELFPRDDENQPEWYRQKLREAGQG